MWIALQYNYTGDCDAYNVRVRGEKMEENESGERTLRSVNDQVAASIRRTPIGGVHNHYFINASKLAKQYSPNMRCTSSTRDQR